MFSPRETEMLAEARIEEWRTITVPEITRRGSFERQLAGLTAPSGRSPRRTVTAWLRGRLAAAAGGRVHDAPASEPGV